VLLATELVIREIFFNIAHSLASLGEVIRAERGEDFCFNLSVRRDNLYEPPLKTLTKSLIFPHSNKPETDLDEIHSVKRCSKMSDYLESVDMLVQSILDEFNTHNSIDSDDCFECMPVLIERECMRIIESIQTTWWPQLVTILRETPHSVCCQLERQFLFTRASQWKRSNRCFERSTLDLELPDMMCVDATVLDREILIPPKQSDFLMDYSRWDKDEDEGSNTTGTDFSDMGDSRRSSLSSDITFTVPRRDSTSSNTSTPTFFRESVSFSISPSLITGRTSVAGNGPGRHLIVFVPGFRGTHYDFKLFNLIMSVHFDCYQRQRSDKVFCFLPSCNDSCADNMGIEDMAEKLAQSLIELLAEEERDMVERPIRRISFIAHSLGGIVVRAMLAMADNEFTYCKEFVRSYSSRLYTFVTLSTPHLGSLGNKKSLLVNSAMWFLRSRGVQVLVQLSCQDHNDQNKTLMSFLARDTSITQFRHVILVGSEQDTFVAAHSALVMDPSGPELVRPSSRINRPATARQRSSSISSTDSNISRAVSLSFRSQNVSCDESDLDIQTSKTYKRSESVIHKPKTSSNSTLSTFVTDLQYNLRKVELVRCNVKFEQSGVDKERSGQHNSTLDRISGKAFHTAYLSNVSFISAFISTFEQYF
jgi:pimeloyl-ACP methyl ester carboxylesterase